MMNNVTNIFSDAQQNICSLYDNLPSVTDCISGGENFALVVRDNLPKDQTALYLIAAGVALFGLSRLLAAPSKQQKVEEDEVLELTPVKQQEADCTMQMTPCSLEIRVTGQLSAAQFQEIEKVYQQWQMQSCACQCEYDFPVFFPILIS